MFIGGSTSAPVRSRMPASTTTAPLPLKETSAAPSAPALAVDGHALVCDGTWLRIARVFDEVWHAAPVADPAPFLAALRTSDLGADLFTFAQALPDTRPRHPYQLSHDNLAVADTTDFARWWDRLPQESRKNTRKAAKRGIAIRPVAFDDTLVAGIKALYDETPIRQGRRFWHYGKDLATVRRENASYLERSRFIGAYRGEELIGFIKFVRVGRGARIMQILSLNAHYDKHPTNALLAAAVEDCAQQGAEHLIYGQYVYGRKRGSSVTEFKRRNGFHEALLPRYYLPLTWRGSVAIAGKLYRSLHELLPEPLVSAALSARTFAYRRLRRA